jgi:hypothetical protein
MIPPHHIRTAITLESPSDQFLRNILQELHDHPTTGHPRRDETLRKIKELYQWPKMNQWITNYVKGCATCQQNKIQTHKKKTPPFRITMTPDPKPFSQIAMDLITGLPQVNKKDTILTVVDHSCSRAAIFIPCATTIMGPGIAQLYLQNVYPWFWPPIKSHIRQRPQVYFTIWESPHNKARNQLQHLHSISPANRWTLRKEESMGGTIPQNSYIPKPTRLDTMASSSLSSPQH